jgi:hypothetical protein
MDLKHGRKNMLDSSGSEGVQCSSFSSHKVTNFLIDRIILNFSRQNMRYGNVFFLFHFIFLLKPVSPRSFYLTVTTVFECYDL